MTNETIKIIKEKYQREFNLQETVSLLRMSGSILMSWGVSRYINFENKALVLKVNGHHHKGYVVIILAWDDTYSFYLVSTHGTVKYEQHMVYFDMLTEAIDKKIERIPEYSH